MPKIRSSAVAIGPLFGAALAVLMVVGVAQSQAPPMPASAPSSAQPKSATYRNRRTGAAPAAALDLHAPPLNHIYPSKQLQSMLAPDDSDAGSATEVSVKGAKYVVRVPGGPGNQLVAVPWALLHPTQAWRIFTPLLAP